jgi:type VI secretion system protein VasD
MHSSSILTRKPLCRIVAPVALVLLSGCSTTSTVSALGALANSALEATGLKKPDAPEVPDALKIPRNVQIKLHASDVLNVDQAGHPLAVIAKIYKLKRNSVFTQVPYEVFLNTQREKELLGPDLLEVREVTLIPGQRYEVVEKVNFEAGYIGVVALFRSPAPNRWRVDFPASQVEKSGIVLGFHSCALTVGVGETSTDIQSKNSLLAPVRCP